MTPSCTDVAAAARDNRSNSAAASTRATSPTPSGLAGDDVPGAFFAKSELKKLASTPSPPATAGLTGILFGVSPPGDPAGVIVRFSGFCPVSVRPACNWLSNRLRNDWSSSAWTSVSLCVDFCVPCGVFITSLKK